MPTTFHVQYGLSRHVGRFLADAGHYQRGDNVVVRTSRGTELGRIVAEATGNPVGSSPFRILRPAGDDDLARARRAELERHGRFDACRRVFDEGVWPIEPIDVEPLLEESRAILHYLGPHQLDVTGLLDALRAACGLDLVFEPVGKDVALEPDPETETEPAHDDHGCGSCGSDGGCGTGGGCGSSSEAGSGCSGCSISGLVSSRRRASTPA